MEGMRKSSEVSFVSSNPHKYREARAILEPLGISLRFQRMTLQEIQSDSLKKIAECKARDAFARCRKPILVEDDGLFIDALGGFPGPYSSYVFDTIGNKGILQLVSSKRKARFVSMITYCDDTVLKTFKGKLDGTISKSEKGKGWGYDPIFIPDKSQKTFAETDKNEISHRYMALKRFASWHRRQYTGR